MGVAYSKIRFVTRHLPLYRLPFVVALAIWVACTSSAPVPNSSSSAAPTRVVGYLASWGVRSKGTRIADLPARDLTHIFYAFAKIGNDGRVSLEDPCVDVGACDSAPTAGSGGNFAELERLKARNPRLKLVISIGGWTGSGTFSDIALTDASRRLFAESAVDLFIRQRTGLFDGIDIDWEFPVAGGMKGNVERAADKQNFTLLLAELRRQLDARDLDVGDLLRTRRSGDGELVVTVVGHTLCI